MTFKICILNNRNNILINKNGGIILKKVYLLKIERTYNIFQVFS